MEAIGINRVPVHEPPLHDIDHSTLTRSTTDNRLGVRFLYPDEEIDDYCYDQNVIFYIQILYIVAAVLWIILCWWLSLYVFADVLVWVLFMIPIVIYGIGYYNASRVTHSIEQEMLGANYLSFGFLIVVVLINWNTPVEHKNKTEFFKLIVAAFVLIMLSMIDVWVPSRELSWVKHLRTILQTGALVLLAMSLYIYYRSQRLQN